MAPCDHLCAPQPISPPPLSLPSLHHPQRWSLLQHMQLLTLPVAATAQRNPARCKRGGEKKASGMPQRKVVGVETRTGFFHDEMHRYRPLGVSCFTSCHPVASPDPHPTPNTHPGQSGCTQPSALFNSRASSGVIRQSSILGDSSCIGMFVWGRGDVSARGFAQGNHSGRTPQGLCPWPQIHPTNPYDSPAQPLQ